MVDIIERIKQHARAMQRAAEQGDPRLLARLRSLRELKALSDSELRAQVQRRHCLSLIARELGLNGWSHLTTLWSEPAARDFGALLYPNSCGGHWNIWSAYYEEAREIRAQHGGYLLPYRHQFVIVDGYFIEDLGLDPEAFEWALLERDWVAARDPSARHRLCRRLLEVRGSALS